MYNNILVPLDLGDMKVAKEVIENAVGLAKINNAKIHALSIFPDYGTSWVADYFKEHHQEDALHKLGQQLTDFLNTEAPEGVDYRPHVVHGSVYEEIINASKKLKCDLIVMGAHRPELSDYLLGPNAARVVRHATASVLVVRR